MPLFAKLNDPQHWRTLPTVWIRRIEIRAGVNTKPLRSVRLNPGMNIVWGQETPEAKDQSFEPGHGLGKTTFCRLIRFCLGENSFGQTDTMTGVQNEFPDGFVDAIVEVAGVRWCVRRHFGLSHSSFARRSNSLITFARRPPESKTDSYGIFLEQVRNAAFAEIPERDFLAGNKSFEWSHLLAICSRDQEARYVDPLVWRSKRSTAELPSFLQPKLDAIRCVLALLNIYTDKDRELDDLEEGLKKRVTALKLDKSKSTDRLQYWEDHHRERLDAAGVEDAKYCSLETGGLFSLKDAYKKVHDQIVVDLAKLDQAIQQYDVQLTLAAATLKERREHRDLKETTADVVRAPAEQAIEDCLKLRLDCEEMLRRIRDLKFSMCTLGNVAYRKCSYVQAYTNELEQGLSELPTEAPRSAEEMLQLAEQVEHTAVKLGDAEKRAYDQLQMLIEEKEKADKRRRKLERELEAIEFSWTELQRIVDLHNDFSVDESISRIAIKLDQVTDELEEAQQAKLQAVDHHRKQLEAFETTFDFLVKRCTTDNYEGVIKLDSEELDFQILHGETGSGEGFEMLAILLSDLAFAILGAAREATHPGIVIHDSPREADLGPHAYRHFLSSMHAVFDSLSCEGGNPIQYIVTTTTPPPKELQVKRLNPLRLGGKHGMLFNKALKTARLKQTKFPELDGESSKKASHR